jgi:hypothetical protein
MKTSTRKRFGGALLGGALLGATVLFLSGAPLIVSQESQTQAFQAGSVTVSVSVIVVHWYVVALFVAGVAGLMLLLIPGREKTDS